MKPFNRISKLMLSCKRSSFHRDVEEEEIQYESSICLSSSYYSVFVVRLAIMVMLAILIGLLTLLTWHITRVYTTKSLNTLAYGLRHELLQRPLLRMWNILNSTVEVATAQVKLSESVIRRYNKKPFVDQAQQVELYEVMKDVTWAMFASRKALNSVTLNYRNGFVQGFHRNHKTNNTFYIYSDLANYSISGVGLPSNSHQRGWNDQSIRGNISAIWYQEPLDPKTGEKLGKPTPIPPDELINIAGISQVPDGTASWHIAVSKYSDSPLLSAALPVWDDPSHQRIVAVVGVTTALYSVGQFMKELVEFHSGHIYLTSQEGWLLATSSNNSVLTNSTTGPKLMMAVDSADHVIRSGARCLQRTYGDKFPINQQVRIENAKLVGHHLYYIDSFFLNLKRLPMVGVVIIPREYIMGKVDEKAWKTLKIIISASLCILVVGCLCIFILTNGVSKEMNLRAALISNLAARRKAEASNNYKSQFLANMSHELRTPMAAVIGLLDILMSDDCLTNEQHSMITQIRKCSTTLLRLLNNILDLSKVESGKLILEETEFDLGRELEGLIDMFSVQCINHNVEIVLDFSDDMPKIVQGDSGRVLQIFANLISNSIKFTTSGHIILRGWCETIDSTASSITRNFSLNQAVESWSAQKLKWKRDGKICSKKDNNKMILCFEVDDTSCGIDPSKWESVFESFEQADPSTTRLHGGTGLGLCIVRTLVKKMNGEIKVVKKSGPGTLMQLYILLGTPAETANQNFQFNFAEHNMNVLLALSGRATRLIMTKWLNENGVSTYEASDWNELTQNLQQLFIKDESNSYTSSVFIVIVDIGFLDLNTEICKQQLNFLDKYLNRANFAWILNHDSSSSGGVKAELRKRGYLVMVNKPLYKAKLIQIFQTFQHGNHLETINTIDEIDHSASSLSSDDDEISTATNTSVRVFQRSLNEEKCLKGIRVLLAEDTAVLQRVATIMLEKMGADVFVVGDGIQAVDALKDYVMRTELVIGESESSRKNLMQFDLVLMDCQMPQMDGYEATKVIRRSECGTGTHIPIVALTAHAMSCDEMKCLDVGMDAYLTKPIDQNLMASTILSLTKGTTIRQCMAG